MRGREVQALGVVSDAAGKHGGCLFPVCALLSTCCAALASPLCPRLGQVLRRPSTWVSRYVLHGRG